MKTYELLLECSHTVFTQFPNTVNPANPRQHVICKACGGGHFAVLRAKAASDWPWGEVKKPTPVVTATTEKKDWAWNKAA